MDTIFAVCISIIILFELYRYCNLNKKRTISVVNAKNIQKELVEDKSKLYIGIPIGGHIGSHSHGITASPFNS